MKILWYLQKIMQAKTGIYNNQLCLALVNVGMSYPQPLPSPPLTLAKGAGGTGTRWFKWC